MANLTTGLEWSVARTLIIGDIHGCYDELCDLLDCTAIGDSDEVIALGDVVDRGPDTPAVYRWFGAQGGRRSLLGNHERKHVRWQQGRVRPALSQQISRYQLADEWEPAVAWMAGLPVFLDLPEALLVHGLFEPEVPVEQQQDRVLTGTLGGEAYLRQQGYPRPWYELYRGPKPLLVGHQSLTRTTEPYVRSDQLVYGLDTGCATGGRLTGLLLPSFELVSVPSRGHHWSAVQAHFAPLLARPRPHEKLTFDELDRLLAQAARATVRSEYQTRARLDDLRATTEEAIVSILRYVAAEHERILMALDAGEPAGAKSLAQRYDDQITDRQLRPLLHLHRQGQLDATRVRHQLKRPTAALALAARLAAR